MTDKKEDSDMVDRKEDLKAQEKIDRAKKIQEMTQRACDKNDEGLRRLSKS